MRSAAARFAVGGQSLAAFGTHSTGEVSPPDPNALPQRGCHVGDLGAGCVAPRSYTRSALGRLALPVSMRASLSPRVVSRQGRLHAPSPMKAANCFCSVTAPATETCATYDLSYQSPIAVGRTTPFKHHHIRISIEKYPANDHCVSAAMRAVLHTTSQRVSEYGL